MYLVVRSYEQSDPRFGNEGFRRVRDELVPILADIEGFVEYYSAYDRERGTVTSISIYETKEGAEESNRVAVDWGAKNLAVMGTVHPTTWAGEIWLVRRGCRRRRRFPLMVRHSYHVW